MIISKNILIQFLQLLIHQPECYRLLPPHTAGNTGSTRQEASFQASRRILTVKQRPHALLCLTNYVCCFGELIEEAKWSINIQKLLYDISLPCSLSNNIRSLITIKDTFDEDFHHNEGDMKQSDAASLKVSIPCTPVEIFKDGSIVIRRSFKGFAANNLRSLREVTPFSLSGEPTTAGTEFFPTRQEHHWNFWPASRIRDFLLYLFFQLSLPQCYRLNGLFKRDKDRQ